MEVTIMTIKRSISALAQKILNKFDFRLEKIERTTDSIDCYITIKNLLKHYQPKHVCDIGANNGHWIKALYNQYPNFKSAVLIEPQVNLIDNLNTLDIGSVTKNIFNVGISDNNGSMVLNGDNACASFLNLNNNINNSIMELSDVKTSVEVLTLDTLYEKNSLPKPDLIKIDVQGLENAVIIGGKNIFKDAKCVVVELSFQEFYTGQPSVDSLIKLLYERGFNLVEIGYIWREDYNSQKKILQFDGIFLKN